MPSGGLSEVILKKQGGRIDEFHGDHRSGKYCDASIVGYLEKFRAERFLSGSNNAGNGAFTNGAET